MKNSNGQAYLIDVLSSNWNRVNQSDKKNSVYKSPLSLFVPMGLLSAMENHKLKGNIPSRYGAVVAQPGVEDLSSHTIYKKYDALSI